MRSNNQIPTIINHHNHKTKIFNVENPSKIKVKSTSRSDQRNNSTMINKSTKESQSTSQIIANTQPNSKATTLSNREGKTYKINAAVKLISPNSDLVSTIRPIRMKTMCSEPAEKFSVRSNGERIRSADFTVVVM